MPPISSVIFQRKRPLQKSLKDRLWSGSYISLDNDMSVPNRRRLYLLFFLSGFCSLVYQMVWTRLAFASFGIITPVLSVVISVFMLGLAAGAGVGRRGRG